MALSLLLLSHTSHGVGLGHAALSLSSLLPPGTVSGRSVQAARLNLIQAVISTAFLPHCRCRSAAVRLVGPVTVTPATVAH